MLAYYDTINQPPFKINNINYKIINYAKIYDNNIYFYLIPKDKNNKIAEIYCNLIKVTQPLLNKNVIKINKLLSENNITPKLIDIQTLKNDFTCMYEYDSPQYTATFQKNILYYELDGIYSLYDYIKLSYNINF